MLELASHDSLSLGRFFWASAKKPQLDSSAIRVVSVSRVNEFYRDVSPVLQHSLTEEGFNVGL